MPDITYEEIESARKNAANYPRMRYRLTHPNTVAVNFPDMQSAGNFLCNFRHSPDFSEYRLHDEQTGARFRIRAGDSPVAVIIDPE